MKEKYVTILLIDALYRCANERCVGILKRGFPCLYSELRTGLQNSLVVIVAATVLHNFALMQKEVDFDEDIEDEEVPFDIVDVADAGGNAKRQPIISQYFA